MIQNVSLLIPTWNWGIKRVTSGFDIFSSIFTVNVNLLLPPPCTGDFEFFILFACTGGFKFLEILISHVFPLYRLTLSFYGFAIVLWNFEFCNFYSCTEHFEFLRISPALWTLSFYGFSAWTLLFCFSQFSSVLGL